MMKAKMKELWPYNHSLIPSISPTAAVLRGSVTDKATKNHLLVQLIQLSGTNTGTITDVDGNFELAGLRNGTYKLIISYVSYNTQTLEVSVNGMSK